jgi:hypothetical protein
MDISNTQSTQLTSAMRVIHKYVAAIYAEVGDIFQPHNYIRPKHGALNDVCINVCISYSDYHFNRQLIIIRFPSFHAFSHLCGLHQ